MKILKELLSEEAYVEEILTWLERWDTEYAKFVDPKIQLLVELEDPLEALFDRGFSDGLPLVPPTH